MKRKAIVLGFLSFTAFLLADYVSAEEWVKFEGQTVMGEKLQLAGILNVPKGDGPFPAVVMLCGCGGLQDKNDAKHQKAWAERLMSWGYVSLSVDSFGPRGYGDICENINAVNPIQRSGDAFSAKSYLAKLKYVDAKHIAVIGWTHGGWAVMAIVDCIYRDENTAPFQAAIAFSPWCQSFDCFDTPLLILIGEIDDWCPASRCITTKDEVISAESEVEMKLVIYPNTHFAFYYEGLKEEKYGRHAEYNPEAAADAIAQTKEFLAKYLKTKE